MTDHRVDGWARRLARSDEDLILLSVDGRRSTGGAALDGVSRALAAPITRRRAVGLIGGAVLAGSLLRPGRARAYCFPGGPKTCTNPKGAKVCVPDNLQCCSNENCAIACPYSYRDCTAPSRCDDTARMCQPANHQEAGVSDANRTKFCSAVVPVTNGCVESKRGEAVRGWCCRPNEECHLARDQFGTCKCPDDPEGRGSRDCPNECCPKGQICVSDRFGTNCKPACVKGRHYDENAQCVCDSGQTCRNGCCPEGQVCNQGRCAAPTDTSNSFKDFFKSFGDFSGSGASNSGAGSKGGGNYLRLGRAAALPAATPVRSALLMFAAVNAQGVAAWVAFTDGHRDRSYRRRVVAPKPTLPKLAGTPGFNPAAAAALDALLAAEAKAYAQVTACATALARSRGALKANKSAQARSQALAAASFASAASKALRGIPALRGKAAAALRGAGIPEVDVPAVDVTEYRDAVEAGGIPGDLAALLKGLGLTADDLKRARRAFTVEATGGPSLIAPLTDASRNKNLTSLANEFAKYARQVRRSPIKRTRVQARRVRPPRAKSSARR